MRKVAAGTTSDGTSLLLVLVVSTAVAVLLVPILGLGQIDEEVARQSLTHLTLLGAAQNLARLLAARAHPLLRTARLDEHDQGTLESAGQHGERGPRGAGFVVVRVSFQPDIDGQVGLHGVAVEINRSDPRTRRSGAVRVGQLLARGY